MKIDHIAISSTNIDESVSWYKQFLEDTEVLYQDETWAFLKSGKIKFAFVMPGQHPPHFAVRVETEEHEAFLKHTFPTQRWKKHRDGSLSFYAKDTSGNMVEFIKYEEN